MLKDAVQINDVSMNYVLNKIVKLSKKKLNCLLQVVFLNLNSLIRNVIKLKVLIETQ